jgi:predicted acylesterase/phospholipase RssA
MKDSSFPSRPLEKIALSCSGGGYRATSFHLGSMSYLNHLQYNGRPLLENVKLISTVSGGSITGVVYALMKQRDKSFFYIYDFLLHKLSRLDLIATGIEKLNPDAVWANPHKTKNLINAFAEQYEQFTEGETFSVFDTMKSHLENVVFNSTEFTNAINFRFKNPQAGLSGNNMIRVNKDQLSEVKLSDVMASSSCFPGGFEPLLWPSDYVHHDSPVLKQLAATYQSAKLDNIGIMDGGIYDNQGIESILNYKKQQDQPYFDLVIISDVASPYMDAYKPYAGQPKTGFRKLTLNSVIKKAKVYNNWINAIFILLILSFGVFAAVTNYSPLYQGLAIGLSASFLLFFIVKIILINKFKSLKSFLVNKIKDLLPDFYRDKLAHLKIGELSVHRAEPLIFSRINSLVTLLVHVFLKVVRRLNYDKLYEDRRYTYRRMSNLINELTQKDFEKKAVQQVATASDEALKANRFFKGAYDKVVQHKIKVIAEEAASFGTTLWFTDQQKLDNALSKLVATGQFTMCYNLIKYLENLLFVPENGFELLDGDVKQRLHILYQQCTADFERFRTDPYFLYEELEKKARESLTNG